MERVLQYEVTTYAATWRSDAANVVLGQIWGVSRCQKENFWLGLPLSTQECRKAGRDQTGGTQARKSAIRGSLVGPLAGRELKRALPGSDRNCRSAAPVEESTEASLIAFR